METQSEIEQLANVRGNTLDYWQQNAEYDYVTTPISVLKYITVLEELNKGYQDAQNQDNWISVDDLHLNMQYYMEYCQMNGYVTPQDWIANNKHFDKPKQIGGSNG